MTDDRHPTVTARTGILRNALALLATLALSTAALAQTATYTIEQSSGVSAPQVVQPPVVAPAAQPPLIDPARELSGAALLAALRKGGFNLYMRHAQANIGQDQDLTADPNWWQQCTLQRNISEAGREQARRVGAAIRALRIPIGDVVASQFCRVRDTGAQMQLGALEVTADLNHMIAQRPFVDVNAARFQRLAAVPPTGRNNVLISHTHASSRTQEQIMQGLQEAEILVYQPDGRGSAVPVARIPIEAWTALLAEDAKR